MPTLHERYTKEVVPALKERFGYPSPMAVPRIERVTVNVGFGRQVAGKTGEEQKKVGEAIAEDLAAITGQRPALTKARKSIAGFKVRQGQPVGAKVTLRGRRMEGFLEKLISVALPRSRDFRGLPLSSIDSSGNVTIGIREHLVFPEISPEKVRVPFGLEVTVTTSAKTREEGLALFRALGFPIQET